MLIETNILFIFYLNIPFYTLVSYKIRTIVVENNIPPQRNYLNELFNRQTFA